MKKQTLAVAVSCALIGASAHAQSSSEKEIWGGVFGEYYSVYPDKFEPNTDYDSGLGWGGEIGIKLNPDWGFRFEVAKLDIDADTGNGNITGERIGVDAMYFINQSNYYIFGGLKNQRFDESYRMADLGLGAHWQLNDKWKVITELAGYYDFGQGNPEYSAKVGIAYSFGKKADKRVSKDSDNDGVIDQKDLCPNTPYGTSVNADGCPMTAVDSDNDGVVDAKDECANTPMNDKVDDKGCSVFTEESKTMSLKIMFDNNSSKLKNVDSASVQEFVDFMRRYGSTNAVIEGYASAPGTDAYNMKLSVERAQNVRQYLVEQYSIAGSRLEAVGYGETKLLDSGNTREAHQKNRRIEAYVTATVKIAVSK
jgi:OOP family OmpA-OmpF porin